MTTISQFLTHPAMLFLAAMLVVITVHVGTMALVGSLFGASLERMSVGVGPILLSMPIGSAELVLRLIPLNGYARFAEADAPGRSIDELPLVARILTVLSGCAVLLALAWLLAGSDSLRTAWQVVEAIARLPFAPGSALSEPTLRAIAFIAHSPFPDILAYTAAVNAAINVLPVPFLNGGQVIIWGLEAAGMPRSGQTQSVVATRLAFTCN